MHVCVSTFVCVCVCVRVCVCVLVSLSLSLSLAVFPPLSHTEVQYYVTKLKRGIFACTCMYSNTLNFLHFICQLHTFTCIIISTSFKQCVWPSVSKGV